VEMSTDREESVIPTWIIIADPNLTFPATYHRTIACTWTSCRLQAIYTIVDVEAYCNANFVLLEFVYFTYHPTIDSDRLPEIAFN
jgi:hypothetical protein